jgi:hypothetical protein
MAWSGPSKEKPVWCSSTVSDGPTSGNVSCTTTDPSGAANPEVAMLQLEPTHPAGLARPQSGVNMQPHPNAGEGDTSGSPLPLQLAMPASYQKFTSQVDLGKYLTAQYHIRNPEQLTSCETCHR